MAKGEELLRVEDLKTYFYTRSGVVKAVDGISFKVHRGETLGIVGESGSGKSVTMMSLLGLIPEPPGRIVGGSAHFQGRDLVQMTPAQLREIRGVKIGMIFQDPMTSLNPYLKISTQLTEVLHEHDRTVTAAAARKKAIEGLERVGIPDAARRVDQYPHQFSGGMRQRVMIAMALIGEPELLIADEPTTALDVTIQAQILDILGEMQRDLGLAIILITHDLGVVAGMSDRVLVMYAGRPVERGTAEEIFYSHHHPYTSALLRSIPHGDQKTGNRLYAIPGLPPDPSRLPPGCPFAPRCEHVAAHCREDIAIPVRSSSSQHQSHCHREARA